MDGQAISPPGDLALVERFVNTTELDTGTDGSATPELTAWLRAAGLASPLDAFDAAGRERMLAVREALRACCSPTTASPPTPSDRRLDRAARDAPCRPSTPTAARGSLRRRRRRGALAGCSRSSPARRPTVRGRG